MIEKTIMILPAGLHLIDGDLISWEENYQYIIDNLKNPYIPKPLVMIDGKDIGHIVNYTQMEDGLYGKIELYNEINISGKYPIAKIGDYITKKGEQFKYVLLDVILSDEKQYEANEYKELSKELQMPVPGEFQNQEEWMAVCVPAVMNEGVENDQAITKCVSMWQNQRTGEMAPQAPPQEKKSKIDILSSIKKLIEKNGYCISDEKILEMFGNINEGKGYLSKLNKRLDTKKSIHEIKVFPKKSVYIEKYDENIIFNDILFTQMIEGFNCPKLFKPYVDEDHQLKEKFADIIDLYIKDDGLYAKIELNEKGINAIKNNIYSYISPEWGDRADTDGDNHKNVLWAITLTNIPALEGENPKLQDQIKLNKTNGGFKNMDKNKTLNHRLATLEGKVSNYKLQDEAAAMMPPEIMEAIQMIKDALAVIDQMTQQNEIIQQQKEEIQAQKEVAEQTALEYKEKFDSIENEKLEQEKETFFENVVKEGKLNPDEVEDWKLQYTKSKDFVTKILSSRPEKSSGVQKTGTTLDNKGDVVMYKGKSYKLSAMDYTIMANQKFDRHNPADVERYIKDVLEGMED